MPAGRALRQYATVLRVSSHGPITRVQLARTAFGRPLYKVSVFQLGDTLIDSGCPATARELVRWARQRDIRRVVITHHHEDHVGGAARLAAELGVRVLAPRAAVGILGSFYTLPLYRRAVWGQPRIVDAEPLDGPVEIGPYSLRPIPTPGHAPDHVALFEPERRWLFTGDLFLGLRVTYLRAIEDAHRILRSLRELVALEPEMVICSHTGFVTGGTRALIRRIQWWERVQSDAQALREEGVTARRITRRLLGREGAMAWASGGAFAKRHLVRSLLSRSILPAVVYSDSAHEKEKEEVGR